MGMGVGEQVRKIELDAYQAFMKVTAVTGMSWVRARRRVAFPNARDPRSGARAPFSPNLKTSVVGADAREALSRLRSRAASQKLTGPHTHAFH
jgi:hypothetical protein